MILLDTHTLIWLDAGLDKLGTKTREQLDSAIQDQSLMISAISFWEVGTLVNKGRLHFEIDLLKWRADLLKGGLKEVPVTGTLGVRATILDGFHGDPADRLIVATAMQENAMLATADEAILKWDGSIHCLDARR